MWDETGKQPRWHGVPLKYITLFVQVFMNSGLVLTLRYSRITPGPPYLASTAVLLSEILKCVVCIVLYLNQLRQRNEDMLSFSEFPQEPPQHGRLHMLDDVFGYKSGFVKMLVPAVLYTLQNNLQFVAASNLDAATVQVTMQCKLLTTAVFAVLLLHQSLSRRKWFSIFLLTCGIALVQLPTSYSSSTSQPGSWAVGMFAVVGACFLSGLAAVYFEKVLKTTTASIWLRNIQLCTASIAIAALGAAVWDGPAIAQGGFFQGYTLLVWATIIMQAMYGVIIALVIKYADNILKGFATGLSVILSVVVSVFAFSFVVTAFFVLGAALVLASTYLYGLPDKPQHSVIVVEKYHVEDEHNLL